MGISELSSQDSEVAVQNFLILISIDISMKCMSLYALSRSKFSFGCYLTFGSAF